LRFAAVEKGCSRSSSFCVRPIADIQRTLKLPPMRWLAQGCCMVVLLLPAACDRPANPVHSLVGANNLPSPKELSQETIQIEREFAGPGAQQLTYELRPDDSLRVTLGAPDGNPPSTTETFHLSSAIAANARSKLWRIRPDQAGVGRIMPTG